MADAAAADLLAEAVEKGDREILALQIIVGDEVEGGNGQGQQDEAAGDRDREGLAAGLDRESLDPGDVEAVH